MSAFIMIAQLLLGLAILVFVHESGHFFAARLFKIRVPKFYLFFNPTFSLFRCKRINGKWKVKFFAKNLPDTEVEKDENGQSVLDENGKPKYKLIDLSKLPDDDWRKYPDNTEYGIGWLPLGGYCQIAGMIDETQTIENMFSEPQSWEFRSKPAWQRLIVVLAGVLVNMLVGILLFAIVIRCYDKEYMPNSSVTDGIYAFESAREIGFQSGDKIISIDGKTYERFQDVVSPKMFFGSIVTVERDGNPIDVVIGNDAYDILKTQGGKFLAPFNFPVIVDSVYNPLLIEKQILQKGDRLFALDSTIIDTYGKMIEYRSQFAKKSTLLTYIRGNDTLTTTITPDSLGLLGIVVTMANYQNEKYSLSQSFQYGWKDAIDNLWLNVKGLGKIISGEEKASSLSGPIGIAQIYGKIWDWRKFWYITGLLSVILAFMNVLPIPGLDGGHAIFTLIELLTGKKVPDSVLQYAQTIGMIILLLLMIFVLGNDIFKLFK